MNVQVIRTTGAFKPNKGDAPRMSKVLPKKGQNAIKIPTQHEAVSVPRERSVFKIRRHAALNRFIIVLVSPLDMVLNN